MKKFVYFLMAAAFVGCMAGCVEEQVENNESSELKNNDAQVVLRAIDGEANTKAQIDGSTGVFTWDNTDRIAIHSTAGYKRSATASVDAGDAKKADFVISKGEATINGFALYPYTLVFDNDGNVIADCAAAWGEGTGSLVVNLPGTYTLADVADAKSPVPSIATYVDDATPLAFNQLGALLRVTLNNIPPSTKSVTIDFNGVKVQGLFTIAGTVTPGSSQIVAEATTGTSDKTDIITINIPDTHGWIDGQDVNVPVPVGTYTNITVTSWDGADGTGNPTLTMTRPIKVKTGDVDDAGLAENWTAERHKARKVIASLPAFSVTDDRQTRVQIAPANLIKNGSAWAFHTNPYDCTFGNRTTHMDDSTIGIAVDNDTPEAIANRQSLLRNYSNRDLFQWEEVTGGISGNSLDFGAISGHSDWIVCPSWSMTSNTARGDGLYAKVILTKENEFPDIYVSTSGDDPSVLTFYYSDNNTYKAGGTPGVFIFPDKWDSNMRTKAMKNGQSASAKYYTKNDSNPPVLNDNRKAVEITKAVFDQYIAAGATFLPLCGMAHRNAWFQGIGRVGPGWSSTSTSEGTAQAMIPYNGSFALSTNVGQTQFRAVRLVRVVN